MVPPKISIIIPIYNAAPYIEQCIRSVLNQTIQDIEIIAVNDGSTDDSQQILDRLALIHKRLHVFQQANKGVSVTRNFGMQQAAGAYIGFCDADDWMEPTMLAELYGAMVSQQCDWAICDIMQHKEGDSPKRRLNLADTVIGIPDDRKGFVHELMRFRYDNANWNKMFVTEIIRKNQLQFNPVMHIYEDILFNLQYMHCATRAVIISNPLYNYRILTNSLYNTNVMHRVPQFNLLFSNYISFAKQHDFQLELEAFRLEMARATYNQFLYYAEVQVMQRSQSFFRRIKHYRQELEKFNSNLFYYPAARRNGVQGIKKQLLQDGYFGMFAFIIVIKPWLRKPYKFARRLLGN